MFDYFYGAQSDQFSFYRVPKVMFTDPAFQDVSADAKILYGLFLDRMGLSARNNWVDEQGRVYIIYTIDQIMKAIGCSDKKVNRMLRELEVVAGLIERKRQGLGKPNLIYVKNFLAAGQNGRFLNRKMDDSEVVETQFLESSEVRGSNTEINNTEYSDTDPFLSADRNEGMREHAQYESYFSITYKLKLNGGDIKAVQGDSGHAQATMVTDQYSHILDDDRRVNAELFENAFYSGKVVAPEAATTEEPESVAEATIPAGVNAELLMKILANPEMAALLKTLAQTLQ